MSNKILSQDNMLDLMNQYKRLREFQDATKDSLHLIVTSNNGNCYMPLDTEARIVLDELLFTKLKRIAEVLNITPVMLDIAISLIKINEDAKTC